MTTIEVNAAGDASERHDIVKSVSITNLLQQRDRAIALFGEALTLLQECYTLAHAAHLGFPSLSIATRYRGDGQNLVGEYAREVDNLKMFQSMVDAGGWKYLMNESGLRSLMSATKREEFDKQLNGDTITPLTRATIEATFGALHDARADMFEQGVIECFKRLSWHYKTNLPQMFGKRIIVTYVTSGGFTNHRTTDQLDDLMRVFHVLDGKPEADHRNGCYSLVSDALRADAAWPKADENGYLSIRIFKNGNGHVTFKRPDLIDGLNRIIARHYPNALPEPR